jgi:TIR domain
MSTAISALTASYLSRRVFISYRREGTAAYARLLYERLNDRFPGSIFLDLKDITPGDDFERVITDKVSLCQVLVALIDRDWISRRDGRGQRRLDDPRDFVRLEIATALNRNIRVIPALLNGAVMPDEGELPECLRGLVKRQAISVTDTDLDFQANLLIGAVERDLPISTVAEPTGEPRPAASGPAAKPLLQGERPGIIRFLQNPSPKNQLLLAASACFICLISQFIGSTRVVTHFFVHQFGFRTARLSAVAVLLLTVGAYAFGARSLSFGARSLYRTRPGVRQYWLIAALLAIFAGAVTLNLFVRPWPKVEDLARQETAVWSARVFENQNGSGGIRVDIRAPGARDQVWTTAQALRGVLLYKRFAAAHAPQIRQAFQYIENERRKTPEPGWGYWPASSRTLTEISAWVALAYLESLRAGIWSDSQQMAASNSIIRELDLLSARQDPASGGWGPISERNPSFTRTYSTMMAVWAVVEAGHVPSLREHLGSAYQNIVDNGIQWLLNACDPTRGWVPNPNRRPQTGTYPGLTAQTLFVLSEAKADHPSLATERVLTDVESSFLRRNFVKLPADSESDVVSDDQHFPTNDEFTAEGMQFLWFPWGVAMYHVLSSDSALSRSQRDAAAGALEELLSSVDQVSHRLEDGPMFILGEHLNGLSPVANQATP